MINKQSSLNIYIQKLINNALSKRTIDRVTINLFLKRIQEEKLIKRQNLSSHFCVFFLPIDIQKKKIYLCHHKKADDWIPPGGHIDENELPIQTVIRECREELSININKTQIEFYNISVKHIDNSKHTCKTHFDIWYLITTKEQPFNFIKDEYYDGKWILLSEVKTLIKKNPDFLKIILTLQNTHFLV